MSDVVVTDVAVVADIVVVADKAMDDVAVVSEISVSDEVADEMADEAVADVADGKTLVRLSGKVPRNDSWSSGESELMTKPKSRHNCTLHSFTYKYSTGLYCTLLSTGCTVLTVLC